MSRGGKLQKRGRRGQSNQSYRIRVPLQFELLFGQQVVSAGIGHSVEISSAMIQFEVSYRVPPDVPIKLYVEWPVRIENRVGLTFEIWGRTVRSRDGYTAAAIERYDFRTRPIVTASAAKSGL